MGRDTLVTSWMSYFATIMPLVTAHFRLSTLARLWRTNPTKPQRSSASQAQHWIQWFRGALGLVGALLLGILLHAHGHTRCDMSTCIAQAKPWFSNPTECFCTVRFYHCGDNGAMNISGLSADDPWLTALGIDSCPEMQRAPMWIKELPALEFLWIQRCNLTTFDIEIRNMKHLVLLSLDNNHLTHLSTAFMSPPELCLSFSLENNRIAEVPEWFGQGSSLVWLDLRRNQLSQFPMPLLSCPDLQLLYLSNNPITSLPSNISTLSTLQSLAIADCQLDTVPSFRTLPDLVELNLTNNNLIITDIGNLRL